VYATEGNLLSKPYLKRLTYTIKQCVLPFMPTVIISVPHVKSPGLLKKLLMNGDVSTGIERTGLWICGGGYDLATRFNLAWGHSEHQRLFESQGQRYHLDCIQLNQDRKKALHKNEKRFHGWAAVGYGFQIASSLL